MYQLPVHLGDSDCCVLHTLLFADSLNAVCIILYCDQQIHIYFTNYHTPSCFDTIVSSSGSL